MKSMSGTLAALALAFMAGAQESKTKSPDFSPDLMIVTGFDAKKGMITLKLIQIREQEEQTLALNNGQVTLTTEKVIGPFQMERTLNLKDCKVLNASGKTILSIELTQRLKVGAAVVVINDGKPLPPAYVQILRPESVILIGPRLFPDPKIQPPIDPAKKMPKG